MGRTTDEWIDADEVAAIAENISAASHGFPPEWQGKLRTWAKRLRASLPQLPTTPMGRTTEEWAALLDGTTPGPWFANVRGFGRIENIGPISGGFSIGDGLDCDEDDARLAALAPEAVAEVVRLRREIDGIRQFVDHFPLVPPLIGTGSTEARAYEMQEKVRHALARILEGDTHDPA